MAREIVPEMGLDVGFRAELGMDLASRQYRVEVYQIGPELLVFRGRPALTPAGAVRSCLRGLDAVRGRISALHDQADGVEALGLGGGGGGGGSRATCRRD